MLVSASAPHPECKHWWPAELSAWDWSPARQTDGCCGWAGPSVGINLVQAQIRIFSPGYVMAGPWVVEWPLGVGTGQGGQASTLRQVKQVSESLSTNQHCILQLMA